MRSAADSRPPLDRSRLAALTAFQVEVLDEAGSTNAVAADRVRAGAQPWTVVVAEHQTSGRGRLDRVWELPARAGLAFSVVVHPEVSPQRWGWLPLLAGLAVAEAIDESAAVKWPNDVLIGDRKVCGVLSEIVPGGTPMAVIGIGINVDLHADELPIPTATSLALAGLDTDRTELLVRVLARLRHHVGMLKNATEAELIRAYAARSATIGRAVEVTMPNGSVIKGLAEAVDGEGCLVVGGKAVHAGDVIHARLS